MPGVKFEEIKKSSNLTGAYYDPKTRELQVQFKGGAVYRYLKVPRPVWTKFKKTFDGKKSAGSFLAMEIKPKFKAVKVEPEAAAAAGA